MRSMRVTGIAAVVMMLVFLLLSWGCGYKNLPLPPETVVPRTIDDLRYSLDESGVQLTWSYPVETIKGTDIQQISSFELYMAEVAVDDYCATCPVPFGEPLEIDGGLTVKEGVRQKASHENNLLRNGYKYFFKVRARNNWWASSADSNIVTFVWNLPISAPTGLEAAATGKQVDLGWSAVTSLGDGSPAKGDILYQVQRSVAGGEFTSLGKPQQGTSYTDTEVSYGQSYSYRVQSVNQFGADQVPGGVSDVVSASPTDTDAPPVPAGVNAVQSGGNVKIIWNPVQVEDLAGYRVYRRAADNGTWKQVGTVDAPATIFTDTSATEEAEYVYAVTAIDTATPPNESKKSDEVNPRR